MRPANWAALFVAILYATRVKSFSIWKALLAPTDPQILRVRTTEEARAMGESAVFDFVGLVQQHGYPAEEHDLTTEDGYIFKLHRITGSPKFPGNHGKKKVVLLQHGILCTSDCWVLRGPDYDLAFLLADAGYDLWVGNLRGNSYGRSHERTTPVDAEFWDYSFHEHGIHDLRTMVDYVRNQTGNERLYYIGHSMGTTMSYVLLSQYPEYNEKFRLMVDLSPIAFWTHGVSPPYKLLVDNAQLIIDFLKSNEIYEVGSQNFVSKFIGKLFCNASSVWQSMCAALFFTFAGNDPEQLNTTLLGDVVSYYPAGTSMHTLDHYLQNVLTGRFQAYDYGTEGNMLRYNQATPLEYQLSKVTAKTAIFYGDGDVLALPQNVDETARRLGNVVLYEKVPYPQFTHLDFMWATDAKELLYERIMEIMEEH